MVVERRVHVVEADPGRPHPLEALARERQEARARRRSRSGAPRTGTCRAASIAITRSDGKTHVATRSTSSRAAHQEAVPAALVARLGELAPVRIGIDQLEEVGPLVAAHLARAEVGVEQPDELVAPHSRSSPPSSDASAATIRARDGVGLGVGQRPVGRLEDQVQGEALAPLRHRRPAVDVEHLDRGQLRPAGRPARPRPPVRRARPRRRPRRCPGAAAGSSITSR